MKRQRLWVGAKWHIMERLWEKFLCQIRLPQYINVKGILTEQNRGVVELINPQKFLASSKVVITNASMQAYILM